jgi:ABC-type dipeptide/oligopeptide/nickel transport system permease subunit
MIIGLVIVGAFFLIALLAGWLAPFEPRAYSSAPLASPTGNHLLGSNDVGQDLFSQLIYGARVSILVGLAGATVSTAIAWGLGLLSGAGSWADGMVTGAADLMLAMPGLPLIILVAAYLGAGLPVVIITLGLVSWGSFARVIRGQVQSELRKPYVEAARAGGSTRLRTLVRHIGPATVPIAVAKFVTTTQYAIVAQASLGFLGLGDPTVVSWGDMLHRAALSPLIYLNWSWLWSVVPPSMAIGFLLTGFALIGWSLEEKTLPGVRPRRAKNPGPAQDPGNGGQSHQTGGMLP